MKRWLVVALAGCFFPVWLKGQPDNRAFYARPVSDSIPAGQWDLHLDYLGFLRNNEFFNELTEGYTLFGNQWMPRMRYSPYRGIDLEAGVFLQQDFGSPGLKQVLPVFSAGFAAGAHRFRFGTLEGGLAHRLAEPLYDFENHLRRRMEYGFQWKWEPPGGRCGGLEAWVDWRNQIYDRSAEQEEIQAGIHLRDLLILRKDSFRILGHFQGTAQHKGGQIDTSGLPLLTWFHGGPGLSLNWQSASRKGLRSVSLSAFALGFRDQSPQARLDYRSSLSPYITLQGVFSWGTLMVNYWHSTGYASPVGGVLFRTVSSRNDRPVRDLRSRELLFLRYIKDWPLSGGLWISLRLEPFFDLRSQRWEFSHGLYFTFRGKILKGRAVTL